MIAWLIAGGLFLCLLIALVKVRQLSKELKTVNDNYETAQWEARNQGRFSEEALNEVEEWKERYVAERAAKEAQEKEAETLRKRYMERIHEDSDSYKTQIGKDEESWGDREPY
jgi:predicted Holliday junction resolvase-like endonuclease